MAKDIIEGFRQALQDILLPEFRGMREMIQQNAAAIQAQQERSDRQFEAMQERMDRQFETQQKRMDRQFQEFRREMDERFARVDERFAAVDERFARVDERLEKLTAQGASNEAKLNLIIDKFDRTFDVSQRVARIEAKMDRMEKIEEEMKEIRKVIPVLSREKREAV